MTAALTALAAALAFCLATCGLLALRLARLARRPPPPGPPPLAETPAQSRHDSGGLESVAKRYRCGCRHWFDGTMRLVHVEPCQPAGLDEELRRLTS